MLNSTLWTKNGWLRTLTLVVLSLALCGPAFAQQGRQVSGTVVDQAGEPLVGVNVLEQGTQNLTITDLDGKYTIRLTTADPELVFTYIGFETQNIKPGTRTTVNVTLSEDSTLLEDVVVIGYGTARKKDLTGAISSVQAENLEAEVPKSVEDLIRAAAPGLYIPMSTNISGGGVNIQVRGRNTLTAASTPLIVVDGVIYNGNLNDINPMDIQTVDVLKDASSVAVYGSKAASGVIAVTTKKGRPNESRPQITFNANVGLATAANIVPVYDELEFLDFRRDYFEGAMDAASFAAKPQYYRDPRTLNGVTQLDWYNFGLADDAKVTTLPSEHDLVAQWLTRLNLKSIEQDNYFANKLTNWDDQIFQVGLQQDYTVGIQHRTDRMTYYWSMGYADREGQIVGDRFRNIRSRLNADTKVTDWLNVGMNMSFGNRIGGAVTAGTNARTYLSPYAEYTTDPTSQYYIYPSGQAETGSAPQYQFPYIDRYERTNMLNGSIYAKLTLPFDITFTSTFSPDWQWRLYANHQKSENPAWTHGGSSERTSSRRYFWQLDNVLNWNHSFNRDHRVEVTLLQNAEKRQNWSETMRASSYSPLDALGWHRMQSGTVSSVETNDTYMTGDALMARLFYSYKDRIMVTASVRRDGNSAFGQKNPRSTFPALALGWVFSDYDFFKPVSSWWNYGKLRLSWGINGNSAIGQYAALAQLTSSLVVAIDKGGTPSNASQIYINTMANSGLQWERTESVNAGLDLQFLGGRIKPTIDVYRSVTSNLLVSRRLPTITGYSSVMANLGKLRNFGFELGVVATAVQKPNFKWETTVNFSFNRRKLLSLYGDMEDVLDANGNVIGQKEMDDPDNGWFIGRDPDQIWNYEMDGVWQLGEEEEAAKYGNLPGDFKYKDQDGDGNLNNADKVFQGYTTPRYHVNWRNNFTFFKNWTLSMLTYAQIGQWNSFNKAANYINMTDRISGYDLPRWTPDNPTNDWGRIMSNNLGTHYINKTFVRVESFTLTYAMPKSVSDKLHVKNTRISVSVRNPFYWAPYWHWTYGDPEGGDYTFRTYNIGINFTL